MVVVPGKEVEYDLARSILTDLSGRSVHGEMTTEQIVAIGKVSAELAKRGAEQLRLAGIVEEAA